MPSWPLFSKAPAGGIAMRFEALKVGELARRTGLTIRTLHHYDEIGLRIWTNLYFRTFTV
jgi:MerR family regulatory protein